MSLHVCIFFIIAGAAASAMTVEVGDGNNIADLYIEWSDGYIAEFLVYFETDTITGLELFDVVESETTLTTIRQDYGWGVFIDGITYEAHSDIGFGGGENWWHFWINNNDQGWFLPAYGVSDRVLHDGDADGWIYGRAGQPVPEPTTLVLLAIAAMVLRKRCI
jgi:hypothetical protein